MQALPKDFVPFLALIALSAGLVPGCHVEVTERHGGEAGSTAEGGETGGPLAGTGGDEPQSTGGTESSGGASGSAGQTQTTGGTSAGGSATAGAATAGAATAGAATAGTAGATPAPESAGAGGIGGAGETSGSAGDTGSAGAAGTDGLFCVGDTSTLSGDRVELCGSLSYADETCPTDSAGDISEANEVCRYVAANGRPGVFEVMFGCLSALTADDVCGTPDTVVGCRDIAFQTACSVAPLVAGSDDYTCADVQAKCPDAPVTIETCERVLFGLDDTPRANVIFCFECEDPRSADPNLSCVDMFTECAFPAGVADGDYPYPGDCD